MLREFQKNFEFFKGYKLLLLWYTKKRSVKHPDDNNNDRRKQSERRFVNVLVNAVAVMSTVKYVLHWNVHEMSFTSFAVTAIFIITADYMQVYEIFQAREIFCLC